MNEVVNKILTRRSVRKFTQDKVPQELVKILLDTALYAPTGGNHQETRFIVVSNETVLEKFTILVREIFAARPLDPSSYQNKTAIVARKPHYDFRYHAPLLINVLAPKEHGNSMADSALAIENIMIAANSLGLGTCYVNQIHWLTEDEKMYELLLSLGMQKNENCFGSVIVGYPKEALTQSLPERVEGRIIEI